MKSKKAMESKILGILLAAAILLVVIILFMPKITNLVKDVLGLSSSDSYCEETGLSAEQYTENIERALYADDTDKAVMYFVEYMECGLAFDKLILRDNEISVQLAEGLCRKGKYGYSFEVFEGIPGEIESNIYDECKLLYEIEYLKNKRDYVPAREKADTFPISTNTLYKWQLTLAETYRLAGDIQKSFDIYDSLYNQIINDPLNILSSENYLALVEIKNNVKQIYLERLSFNMAQLSTLGNSYFCVKADVYIDGIKSSDINLKTEQNYGITIPFGEDSPDITFNYEEEKENEYYCQNLFGRVDCWNKASTYTPVNCYHVMQSYVSEAISS